MNTSIRCARCRHPMKHATETGMGPVCARKAKASPVPAHERDLFGYDLEKAAHAARYRVQVLIAQMGAEAYIGVRNDFQRARERLLGWAVRA